MVIKYPSLPIVHSDLCEERVLLVDLLLPPGQRLGRETVALSQMRPRDVKGPESEQRA